MWSGSTKDNARRFLGLTPCLYGQVEVNRIFAEKVSSSPQTSPSTGTVG